MKLCQLMEMPQKARFTARTRRKPSQTVLNRYIRVADSLPFETRHEWVKFIHFWLSGNYMDDQQPADALQRWWEFARLFPPGVSGPRTLYRVVTIPVEMAGQTDLRFRPAPNPVSSWTETRFGMDTVVGVAWDIEGERQGRQAKTARVGIQAVIPANLVLATRATLRYAFLALTHDYWDRFPEVVVQKQVGRETYISVYNNKDWPEPEEVAFNMGDVGYLQDLFTNINGGPYRQYEWIVETPPVVDAKIVKRFRIGNRTLSHGHDDPHNS